MRTLLCRLFPRLHAYWLFGWFVRGDHGRAIAWRCRLCGEKVRTDDPAFPLPSGALS